MLTQQELPTITSLIKRQRTVARDAQAALDAHNRRWAQYVAQGRRAEHAERAQDIEAQRDAAEQHAEYLAAIDY